MSILRLKRIAMQGGAALKAGWAQSMFIIASIGLGVASLTIILAAMEGAHHQASELAAIFGPTSINVMGGGGSEEAINIRPMTITWNDQRQIRDLLPEAESVAPFIMGFKPTVAYAGKRYTADNLCGATANHGDTWGWYLSQGRDFTEEDVAVSKSVCFIGSITAGRLFGKENPIGKIITVNGIPLTVIGVHSTVGLVISGDMEFDDRVTVPITTMISRFNLDREHLTQLRIKFTLDTTPEQMAVHAENLRTLLRELHHLHEDAPDDFFIMTMQSIISFVDLISGSVAVFLGVVAAVSLAAGGFSQANLFYLSVSDRCVEIGLRKALGATDKDIMAQFLLEALLLAVCGSLFGLLLGVACAYFLGSFGVVQIRLAPSVFFYGFVAACIVSCVFSVRPAQAAASLPPVNALKGLA